MAVLRRRQLLAGTRSRRDSAACVHHAGASRSSSRRGRRSGWAVCRPAVGPPRHRASDAGATLAPRGAAPGIGGSMRLPPSAAAALVGRDSFHSARMPYVPESPPDSPEPYAAPQPTRHSSAYASYTTRHEAAPRRKGGFMSGFTKSLKKAFGFGSSRRKDSYSRNAGASSSHHSTDASLRPPPVSRVSSGRTSGTLHRMDSAPQSPERVQVRLSDADRETNLDPAEFRSLSIPTSPGTRSDCELLAHSFGREHGAELAYARGPGRWECRPLRIGSLWHLLRGKAPSPTGTRRMRHRWRTTMLACRLTPWALGPSKRGRLQARCRRSSCGRHPPSGCSRSDPP